MSQSKKPALIFIFITMLIDVLGIGLIIPILPNLIESFVGGGAANAAVYGALLMASYSVMQFLFSPIMGGLSDQYGRRPIILCSLIGFTADYLLLFFASSLGWLFLGRILAGITGASFTTATAYIADISKPEERAKNFGLVGMAFGVGFIIGPILGGFLGEIDLKLPFLASAGLTMLNAIYGYFVLPESLSKDLRRPFEWKRANPIGTILQIGKYPLLFGLAMALFCIQLAGQVHPTTWPYFTKLRFQWTPHDIGMSLGFVGITIAFVQGYLSRIVIPLWGEKKSIFIGLILWSIGFFLFSIASQGWMMYAIMIPFSLGGIVGPSLMSLMSQQVSPSEQGELQGGITSITSITAIVGPLLSSSLFEYFSSEKAPFYYPGAAFASAGVLAFIGLCVAYASFPKKE